jgi:transcription initiation factor IIE alpha subunit
MKENPIILHIELGNQSVYDWLKENQYVIFSELIRYSKKLLDENLDMVQAIMVSNLSDNIVFIIKRDNVKLTLDKAMEYFMDMEEYEKCAEIRDLDILIQNLENEATNIKVSKSNQRKLKVNR